jgi:ABC-2 type transport system ATP-binding protein
MNSIVTNNLTKIYTSSFGKKNVQALADLNLTVSGGSIFGLLGPNGAGKTTLVKILLGITFATSGNANILNEDISNYKIKNKIGYLPENHKYPSYLTGMNVLKFFGKLNGLEGREFEKKIDELLELVKLSKWKNTKVKAYSKGMMQRLGLAQTLINDPELIFLDEPTDGVDPIGRKEIRDILLDLKSQSKTIFLNSHLLSEVELITDRVGILNKGKLLREGTVKEFTERKEEYTINLENDFSPEVLNDIQKEITFSNIKAGSYSVKVADLKELNKFIDMIRHKGILIKEINPLKSTLEEMFISLIEKSDKGENS